MRLGKISRMALLTLSLIELPALPALSANPRALPASPIADRVLVLKSERKLLLIKNDAILKTYIVSLGGNPVGPKQLAGDRKTPEGVYTLDRHNSHSQYHRSIHISYPNEDDLARVKKFGFPTGSELFIHGLPNDYKGPGRDLGDWTNGCIAVTNQEIDEIWRMVADGTPIEIRP